MAIGERTNANGSKKFREAMLEARWDDCVEMARDQIREGAHMLDLCVDYVGRDGVADMEELAGRFATASTLPIVLDSTELPVLQAGLEKLGGRAVINSVNYEDGDGPESRFAKVTAAGRGARRGADRADHRRGGPGPHRRAQGRHRRAADRRPDRQLGHPRVGHPHRHSDLHDLHRAGGVPQGRHRDHRARSASSSAATRTCRPRSACRTSPSVSIRPPVSSSTRCSWTSV